jgi:hypothetical protein
MRYDVSPPPLGGVCWQPPAAGHHDVSKVNQSANNVTDRGFRLNASWAIF